MVSVVTLDLDEFEFEFDALAKEVNGGSDCVVDEEESRCSGPVGDEYGGWGDDEVRKGGGVGHFAKGRWVSASTSPRAMAMCRDGSSTGPKKSAFGNLSWKSRGTGVRWTARSERGSNTS
jgi:hypothetical protein